MIAVHNFHIAIEILTKAVLLHHEIRGEKTLNIDFESMLAEIDKHPPFKARNIKIPYRQELRNLNQYRNLVQHHAMVPEQSVMDDFRVFTRRFLEKSIPLYFDIEFSEVSRFEFIEDSLLKKLASNAYEKLQSDEYEQSVCLSAALFVYGSSSITDFLPHEGLNSAFFATSGLRDFRDLTSAIEKTHDRIRDSERFTALVASGLKLADIKRFESRTPHVTLAIYGHPWFQSRQDVSYGQSDAEWAIDYAVSSVLLWQRQELNPSIRDHWSGAVEFINGEWPKEDA
tara:strand:- start:795 stop:1649 length:855 start_codon:yes stop_codon:yes gene_type:complete